MATSYSSVIYHTVVERLMDGRNAIPKVEFMPRHIRRVAIVDDDPCISTIIALMLRESDIQTEVWPTGISPSLLGEFDPDLILLDIQLGVSDAFTVLRSQIPPTYRGVVSIVSGQGIDVVMDVMLLGERLGLRMGAPALKPFGLEDLRELVSAADELLERRTIGEWAVSRHSAATPSQDVRLRQALDEDLLEVWYQPKFLAASGLLAGAEALIRARTADGAIVSPGLLLRDAAKQDLLDLTDTILSQAIAHGEALGSIGFKQRLSVNIPSSYLFEGDPCRLLRQASQRPGWPGLIFEITEDEALSNVIEAQMIATQLRLYSVSLSIDDFGSAYSSLARLRDLPFTELKLDRGFVHNCSADSTRRSICANVLALGAELGVTTVAEGVEDQADLQFLNELGFDQVQGFLLAKPMPFARLLEFVRGYAPGHAFLAEPSERLPRCESARIGRPEHIGLGLLTIL